MTSETSAARRTTQADPCEWAWVDLSGAGRAAWEAAFEAFPDADVYYHPGYAEVLRRNGEGEPACLVVRSRRGLLLFPFLQRPIDPELARSAGLPPTLMDVVTPYGYGGPAVAAADEAEEAELLARYRRIIAEEFPCRGLVAEFIRFHPVLANHRGDQPGLDRVRRSQTVAFDLTRDPERLWNEMDPTSRNKARRAIKGGVVIAEDGALAHFESFHDNYLETMRRRDAAAGYHYSLEFFRDTVEQLAGMVNLFVARSQGHVVNAALILQRGSHAHYHFSGSDETRRVPGANNLLLYEVALWARSRGARTLHLGGGRRPGDTLFQFKASFSPLHLDFWTGTAIHLPEAYERLCAAAAARRDPAAPPVDPAFFPRYRA